MTKVLDFGFKTKKTQNLISEFFLLCQVFKSLQFLNFSESPSF